MNIQGFEKERFIIEECMMFSFNAGVQTRNKLFPIYNDKPLLYSENRDLKYQSDNVSNVKLEVFDFLDQYLNHIIQNGIKEEIHLYKIQELSNRLTQKFKPILYNNRFRIGISQKIINLFLKYMWSLGQIPEPCHCPIDGIIKSKIRQSDRIALIDWTGMDSIFEYRIYIDLIKEIAQRQNLTIAQWEFINWKRR